MSINFISSVYFFCFVFDFKYASDYIETFFSFMPYACVSLPIIPYDFKWTR